MLYPMGAFWIVMLMLVVIWDAVWKGIGLWKAGRHNQMGWFIAIFIFNTVGILPIIYLAFFQKKATKLVRKVKKK